MHAADTLQASIDRTGSLAVVGLDPRPALIPPALRTQALARHGDTRLAVAWAFAQFNRGLLAAVQGACCAVKPQVACYEAYGAPGLQALEETISEANRLSIPVIVDGKRNDIGSTAEHYAQAWLGAAPGFTGALPAGPKGDWLTVNAYLGSDGVKPFLAHGAVFVLVKTSNPGSGEFQGLKLADGDANMEAMAKLVRQWGEGRTGACGLNDVGAVVGATWPAEAKRLRALMPNTIFLVPGYGAQGGSAADALAGRRPDGRGCVVNSSRAIIGAWEKPKATDWASAARAALDAMNKDLASAR
ncbi:MAG TPA: orotidine-5'-phosphate decarboxylase [Planctomycetes bacterium]|nr:orotidine-5'-phosphate decarboxylase [Planctomycetota bacterium]